MTGHISPHNPSLMWTILLEINTFGSVEAAGSTVSFSFSFSSSSFLSNAHFKPFFEVLRKRQVLFSFLFSLLFSISRKFFLWPFFTSYSGLRDEQIGRQKRGLLKRKTLHQRVADTRFLQNFIANILKNYGARKYYCHRAKEIIQFRGKNSILSIFG